MAANALDSALPVEKKPTINPALTENIPVELRTRKEIGQSLDAEVEIRGTPADDTFAILSKREAELPELFIVSSVVLVDDPDGGLEVEARHAPGVRCPRSWRWVPELVSAGSWGEVSPRCVQALANRPIMDEVSS